MYYKCENCEHIFEEGEEARGSSFLAFYGDEKVLVDYIACPCCGSDNIVKATKCQKCGKILIEDETKEGYCEKCAKEIVSRYKYDISTCYNVAKKSNETQSVDINLFLATMFTEKQINEILYRELATASAFSPIDCTPFTEDDEDWFFEKVLEEVKE